MRRKRVSDKGRCQLVVGIMKLRCDALQHGVPERKTIYNRFHSWTQKEIWEIGQELFAPSAWLR